MSKPKPGVALETVWITLESGKTIITNMRTQTFLTRNMNLKEINEANALLA